VEVVLSHCCRMTFCLLPRCPISSIVWRLFTDFVKLASLLSLFREHVPFVLLVQGSLFPLFTSLYMHVYPDSLVLQLSFVLIYKISYI